MLTRRFDYIVTEGDTMFGIALKFNVPLSALLEINQLSDPNTIYPGQIIQIPVSEEFYQIAQLVQRQCSLSCGNENTAAEANEAEAPANADAMVINEEELPVENITFKRHRVRRGDTVYLLAREYNTTTGNILALNPQITDVRNLKIGSVITIPIPPENSFIYTVRPGDTVYGIAKANGVTVEDIMAYNFIEADHTLYPGQQLVIVK